MGDVTALTDADLAFMIKRTRQLRDKAMAVNWPEANNLHWKAEILEIEFKRRETAVTPKRAGRQRKGANDAS